MRACAATAKKKSGGVGRLLQGRNLLFQRLPHHVGNIVPVGVEVIEALVIPWVDDFPDDIARAREPQIEKRLTQMKDALHSETELADRRRVASFAIDAETANCFPIIRLKTSVIEEP